MPYHSFQRREPVLRQVVREALSRPDRIIWRRARHLAEEMALPRTAAKWIGRVLAELDGEAIPGAMVRVSRRARTTSCAYEVRLEISDLDAVDAWARGYPTRPRAAALVLDDS